MRQNNACECYCRGGQSANRASAFHSADQPVVPLVHQEVGAAFINVSAPSIVSGMSGESEKTLRETFEEAAVG